MVRINYKKLQTVVLYRYFQIESNSNYPQFLTDARVLWNMDTVYFKLVYIILAAEMRTTNYTESPIKRPVLFYE